jgi:hypothetical protein
MRGVSTLVGVVLLLLVSFLAVAAFALLLGRTAGIWPTTTPRIYLQLVEAFSGDGQTGLVFQQQGGETLRASDLLLVLEGTLPGGERARVRVENLSSFCSENEIGTGKFTITVNRRFENIERLILLHRPTEATIFYLSLPLKVSE